MKNTPKRTLSQSDLKTLPASELRWLASHKCEHRHSYLEHIRCYKGKEGEPNIYYFDLETTAHRGYFWGRSYETDIIEITEYGKILSYAGKWNKDKIFCLGWIDFRKKEEAVIRQLWKDFDKADFIVAHNARKYDIRWAKTRFEFYGLPQPSPYKVLDTLLIAKKHLNLPSYSLNAIADYFGIGHKKEHEGWALWKKCIAGDKDAWRRMKDYNSQDVNLLAKVYARLAPFEKPI